MSTHLLKRDVKTDKMFVLACLRRGPSVTVVSIIELYTYSPHFKLTGLVCDTWKGTYLHEME